MKMNEEGKDSDIETTSPQTINEVDWTRPARDAGISLKNPGNPVVLLSAPC